MFIYSHFVKGALPPGHKGNDDCAICRAWNKKNAIKKFSKLYINANEDNVKRAFYNIYRIFIISDY